MYSLLEEERVLTQNVIVGAGTILAGVAGLAFQALASHQVRPADYGDVFTVITLLTLIGLPGGAFTLLMARETSRDRARGEYVPSATLLNRCHRILMLTGLVIAAAVAIASPLIGRFLAVPTELLLVAAPGIPFAVVLPLLMGEFQGNEAFLTFSVLSVFQAGLKLLAAIGLGVLFGPVGIIAGISLSTVIAYLVARYLVRTKLASKPQGSWWRPAAAYLAVVLPSTLSRAALLSADVLVVKHFFAADAAGEYAAVAALGRAIFWGATGVATVLFPKVVFRRTQGLSGLLLVNASIVLVAIGGLLGLGVLTLGSTQLLVAFAGAAYQGGAIYLPAYGIGMTLLGGVTVLTAAHLSRGKPEFLAILVPGAIIETVLLIALHNSLFEVVVVLDLSMAAILAGLALLYIVQERVGASVGTPRAVAAVHPRPAANESLSVLTASLEGDAPARRRLRILILNWRCPHNPRAGGAERLTHEVARRLVARGHTIEWFASSYPGATATEDLDGFRVRRGGNRWTVYWRAFLTYRRSLTDQFDVVVDEVNVVPFFAPLWSRLPTFMLIHQLAREIWWYEAPFPLNLLGFALEPIYLRVYRDCPVLTVSSSTSGDLRRLGFRGQITVIPEGVEAMADSHAPKPDEPSFLYVGRLVPSKRIEHILMALARFRQTTGTGQLWLVGNGLPAYRNSLIRLSARLGLEDSVAFYGHLSAAEKHHLMSQARALLMTSVREGWGLVVTEANACGTPAIVYNVPGLRDSVVHEATGLVVAPRPESLADAMLRVTQDPDLYVRLVEGGRRWSSAMTFDATARVIGQTLEDATAN